MNQEEEFISNWKKIASDLGLEIEAPFELTLPSGKELQVPVLLKGFGAKNEMLLVLDYDVIASDADEIANAGFGFSVLSVTDTKLVDLKEIREMLKDWGDVSGSSISVR